MGSKEFEVISVLGPLGAGKTTTLNHLIEKVPLGDSYAVVVNDVGENNIDAQRIWDHPANRSEKVIPLTAGCIGCSDVTQFREALERVHDAGVNVLFIEPTGIAPGTEIAEVVASSGFDLSVLTLANARTIERDMKWQVLPSQLSVADIVGLTHIPNDREDAAVMSDALERLPYLPEDVTVELIKPGDTDYFRILSQLRGQSKQVRLGGQALMAMEVEHDHGHDHSHGISAKSFLLKSNISPEQVKNLLLPYIEATLPLIRAKGVVGGVRFDIVGDEWNTLPDTSGQSTMNVIFGEHMPADFLEKVRPFMEPVERIQVTGDKKAIVKSISDMPVADRTEIALQRSSQYPSPISPMHGELIPDCEADEGYEIAFWGLNDDMPNEIKHRTINAYIAFRLGGVHELLHHPEHIKNIAGKRAYWLRRYGATLGYNGYYLNDFIDDSLLDELHNVQPARLLYDGFMELSELTFDDGRAEEKPEFIASVCKAALQHSDLTNEDVANLLAHALLLSEPNDIYKKRWMNAFHSLVEE